MMYRDHIAILCRRSYGWGSFAIVFFIGGSAGQYVYAQGAKPPIPSAQKVVVSPAQVFSSDLARLSNRFGVAFVAEGQPIPVTKEGPAPSLSEKLSQADAVREVADYFDYSAARHGSVYLLTKRYTTAEDLPDVTPEECRSGLKAIAKILATFNPRYPKSSFGNYPQAHIASLLSAEQLGKLGKDGLLVSELTPIQHEEVWRLALNFYLQSQADQIEQSYTDLENRNPADPVFHWQTIMNVRAFGYDTRSVHLNDILFIPVSNSNQILVAPDGGKVIFDVPTHNGKPAPRLDPTDPTTIKESAKQSVDDQGKSSCVLSLSEVISPLNGKAAKPDFYKVDPMYAAKHVTLVGVDKLPADVLMRSIAAVYGRRVAKNEDGSFLLTHPSAIEAKQLTELGSALRSAIPAPIYRAIQAGVLSTHKEIQGVESPVLADDYQVPASVLRRSAMQMFRYIAEPKVKSQPTGKLALSCLGDPARSMFEFANTIGLFSTICWLADRPQPPYISDIDHVILTGGIYRNEAGDERFSLFFSYTNPKTGALYKGVGFSNAPAP